MSIARFARGGLSRSFPDSGYSRFKHRETTIELPQLDVVDVNELLNAFSCFLFVGAPQIGHADNLAALVQKVRSVVCHPIPQENTVLRDETGDHKNFNADVFGSMSIRRVENCRVVAVV